MTTKQEIKPGYKKTIVGIIPRDWEVKRLGSLSSHFKSGKGITSKNIEDKNEYPVYGGNGLRGFTDNFTHTGSYLLIGRQGALCGNIQTVEGEVFISEHAIAVQTNDKNDLGFLASKLEYFNLNRLSESSAQPGLAVNKLVRLKLPIPPLPEQKAIADCLSTWDKGIEKLTALIQTKKEQKKGLMQQLLTGEKRLNGFTEEWKEVRLGEVAAIKKGKTITSSSAVSGQYDVIAGGKVSPYTHNNWNYENVVTVSASGAYAGYVQLFETKIWASDCSVIQAEENTSKLRFIYSILRLFQERIYLQQTGGAQPHIYPDDLKSMPLLLPKLEEQTAIAEVLTTADKQINLLERKLSTFQTQKKGLMQVLLTGERRLIEN